MTQETYKIRIPNRGDLEVVVHGFKIGVLDRKHMTYLEYRNGKFIMKEIRDFKPSLLSRKFFIGSG